MAGDWQRPMNLLKSLAMPLTVRIPDENGAERLEDFLRRRYPLGAVRRLLRKHAVRVNGRRARGATPVRGGDTLTLFVREEELSRAAAGGGLSEMILYEDDQLAVLDKPAGVAVHGGRSVTAGKSLLDRLLAHYSSHGLTPRLVHRLDQQTSGCLVVAKEQDAALALDALFRKGKVRKEYFALVVGVLPLGERDVDLALPGRSGDWVRAVSRFRVVRAYSEAEVSLLEARLETGRMHQIRRHLAKTLHPVVMDNRYGDFAFNKEFRRRFDLRRQFLHARHIAFTLGGRKIAVDSPLPRDLQRILDQLS